jgi:hypothetical protein
MTQTAKACIRETCDGCVLHGRLLCVHRLSDLLDFAIIFIMWAIPFFAGMINGRYWTGLVVWLVLAAVFFIYVEALILCRHCPHYAEDGATLTCHANYGLPKIPAFDPRPLNKAEQTLWVVYVLALFLYYVPFFVASRQWLLLAVTSWAALTWAWTVQRTMCNRCYNLSCPINRVPEAVREEFFKNYPQFARTWGKEPPEGL